MPDAGGSMKLSVQTFGGSGSWVPSRRQGVNPIEIPLANGK
jgi:hypothetical protein